MRIDLQHHLKIELNHRVTFCMEDDSRGALLEAVNDLSDLIISQGEKLMALTQEQNDAVLAAVNKFQDDLATEISTAVAADVAAETAQIMTAFEALRTKIEQGTPVSDNDLQQVLGQFSGMRAGLADRLKTSIGAAIDKISTDSTADTTTQPAAPVDPTQQL